MKPILSIDQVSIAYDSTVVVRDISLQLQQGEIACLLGPSGCGKTTLLRAIAGFEKLKSGQIRIRDAVVSSKQLHQPPEQRHIGMVFQDFALFPHLDVAGNIAFGIRNLKRSEQKKRIEKLLKLVSLQDYGKRYPHELSGGQQQRIALARALAPKPDVLLLDEPFSSMDVELREELSKEVRQILKHENITAILVTHDQNEAFAMADRIAVMNQGSIEQWADDYMLYHQPQTPFVADFIGKGNFISGEVSDTETIKCELADIKSKVPENCLPGCAVNIFIRPEDVIEDNSSVLKATILDCDFRGADFIYTIKLPSGTVLQTLSHKGQKHAVGDKIGVRLDSSHVVVFKQ